MIKITTHTLVKNEDRWIWFALKAWEPYASEMLVYDDSSDDQTAKVIHSLDSKKIDYHQVKSENSFDIVKFRQEMKEQTKTNWFVLLDGDEIWDSRTIERFIEFLSNVDSNVKMVALETRNCIGDVFHYLGHESGRYEILGHRGNYNIRAYRNSPDLNWYGRYPLEYYSSKYNYDLTKNNKNVAMFNGFYWHMTHLARSSSKNKVLGWRTKKFEIGKKVKDFAEFPEVFNIHRPNFVADPYVPRSKLDLGISLIQTPLKIIKRKLKK